MTIDPHAQGCAFSDRRPVTDEEVLKLRRYVWADGAISLDEASQLFQLNDETAPSNEWTDFFIEAMCDYLISRGQPRGYVTDGDAHWLIDNISRDGRVESHAELELIVKLLERAEYVPDVLKAFALKVVENIVITGDGPTRRGGNITPGRIDDAEVALLRRLIFASAGDAPAKVGRAEAEMLFRLKDATLKADNSADWKRLFVQGIANHLMAHQSFEAPSPEVAQRLEQPYKANPLRVFGGLRNPASRGEAFKAAFGDGGEGDRMAAHEAGVAADALVTSDEAHWLRRLFERDGARDELEQALLDFLAEDGARPF